MKNDDFQAFNGEQRLPLLVSFLNHARDTGYFSQVSFDFFDAYVFDAEQSDFEPVVAVKQVKNRISKDQMERLVVDSTPTKVVLVEGDRPDHESLLATGFVLARAGVGIYVRESGWVYAPRRASVASQLDLRLEMAPGWEKQEGVWRKQCRSCGEWKGTNDYYERPASQRTARDPFRQTCRTCFREKRNESRAA